MKFLKSNSAAFRLLRTVVQGIIGVLIANLDLIIGTFSIQDVWRPVIAALIMAVLSPLMAAMGGKEDDQ